jgi:hypothetical protein
MRCLCCGNIVNQAHDPTGCHPGEKLRALSNLTVYNLLAHGRSWRLSWDDTIRALFKRPPNGFLPGSLHDQAERRFLKNLRNTRFFTWAHPRFASPRFFYDTPNNMYHLAKSINQAIEQENTLEFPAGMHRLTRPAKFCWEWQKKMCLLT